MTSAIFLLIMNVNIKYYLYTSIERKHVPSLVIRVLMGVGILACVYTSVKYLPLIICALFQNLAPLVTALFSYLFLKKGLDRLD